MLMSEDVFAWVKRLAVVPLLFVSVAGDPEASSAQSRPSLQASRVASSISIDGRLDEQAWQQAETVSDFRQFEPSEGAPATQRTEVRVLYGENDLYVGALLHDDDPAKIEQALGRRDGFNRADWFLVSIDSYFDRRTAYTFGVNAAGVQLDATRTGDQEGGPGRGGGGGRRGVPGADESWDAIWYSDVRITAEGWVVEMRIPYSMLRFPDTEAQTWGIHFARRIPRLGEESEWPLVRRTERANLVAGFGLLTGIRDVDPKRNLQIRPYTVARLQTREDSEEPGRTAGDGSVNIGGDLKVGLGSNITLDATINPDFGQVEADPATLNLTAFENVFDERRPFFVEGSQIYRFSVGPGQLLYTRRIGATAPIVGAAKVSGRTEKGLSFGLLGATTGADLNPTRNYGAGRFSQQLGEYSSIGGILTAYDGTVASGGSGRQRSLSGGADWDVRLLDNQYGIEGFAAMTHRWQTLEAGATETGFAGNISARKRQGAWQGFLGAIVFSDEFNPNDVGQVRANNFSALVGNVSHQVNDGQPFGPVQRANIGTFALQRYAYSDGLNLGQMISLNSRWMLRTFQQIQLGVSTENPGGGYDLYETRGLGPWARPASIEFSGEIDTDERRSWRAGPEVSLTMHEDGGRGYGLGLGGRWNASNRFSFGARLQGEWENDVTAWSSNESFRRTDDGWMIGVESASPDRLGSGDYVAFNDKGLLDDILADVEPVSGDRYYVPVFGARDTRSLDLTVRSTVTFTPVVSLQLYGQLFVASGRYDRMQILQNRDELASFDAFPKRAEFSLNSLQSNAVMRWEYRPGSTLFFVWTHGRQGRDRLNPLAPRGPSPFDRSLDAQISETFEIFPDNVFLIKLSHTFLR